MKHKYESVIQVGDEVKYKNGTAHYYVCEILGDGVNCKLQHKENEQIYTGIYISKLEIISKNPKILSHKEIEKRTLNKEYREKTNPHKKVYMPNKKPKAKLKPLDYLITEFEPLLSNYTRADVNDLIRSRKVVTGKEALSEYILELDAHTGIKLLREVRILGREVKIDIKREVVIK